MSGTGVEGAPQDSFTSQSTANGGAPVVTGPTTASFTSSAPTSTIPTVAATATNNESNTPTSNSATALGGGNSTPGSSSPTSQPTSRQDGQSPGVVAGIAIACAVIGAVIAALVTVCILRKRHRRISRTRPSGNRRRQVSPEYSDKAPGLVKNDTIGEQVSTRAPVLGFVANGSVSPSIDALLPQQEDDAAIRQCYLLVFDQIELHVYNFYCDKSLGAALGSEQQAELSWFGTSALSGKIAALPQLLQHSSQSTKIIQHCLAYYAVRLISAPTSSSSETIYPQHLASLLSIAGNSLSSSEQSDPTESEASRMLAKARWRQLTAHLKPELFMSQPHHSQPSKATSGVGGGNRGPSKNSDTIISVRNAGVSAAEGNERIQAAAKRFTSAFAPFAAQDDAENFSLRVDHLADVLNSALQMALWLFKEPASFRFDWRSSSADPRPNAAGQRSGGGLSKAKGSGKRGTEGTGVPTASGRGPAGANGEESSVDLIMMPGLRKTHDANGASITNAGLTIVVPVTERVSWRH